MNHGSSTYLLSSFLSIYCIYLWQNRGKSQLIHFKQNTWHCTKMTIIVEEVGLKIFPDGDNLLLIYILWERCLIIHYWFYWVKSQRKKEILSSHRQPLFIQPPVSRTGRKEWTDLLKANWESKSEISETKHACCYHCLKLCMEESALPKLSNHLLKQTKRLNIHLQNIWQKCELAKCSQNSLCSAGTCEAETKVGSGDWVLINSLKRKHCHSPKWDRP